jgi:hypothetical protein
MLRLGFVNQDWDTFRAGDQILFSRVACPLPDSDWVVTRAAGPSNRRVVSEAELYQILYNKPPTPDADTIFLNEARSIEVTANYRVPAYSRWLFAVIFKDAIEIVVGISEDSIISTCLPLAVLKAHLLYTGTTKVQVLRFLNGSMPSQGVLLWDGLAADIIKKMPDRAWAEMEQNTP